MEGSGAGDVTGAGSGGGSGWGSGAGEELEDDEDENMVYYFLEESTGYMEPALRCLSLLHTLVAFLCIIGYNCLKVGHGLRCGPGAVEEEGARREDRGTGGFGLGKELTNQYRAGSSARVLLQAGASADRS